MTAPVVRVYLDGNLLVEIENADTRGQAGTDLVEMIRFHGNTGGGTSDGPNDRRRHRTQACRGRGRGVSTDTTRSWVGRLGEGDIRQGAVPRAGSGDARGRRPREATAAIVAMNARGKRQPEGVLRLALSGTGAAGRGAVWRRRV